jgi:starch phosphorylase
VNPFARRKPLLNPVQTPKPFTTPEEFGQEAVRHIETTLARSLYNCDETAAYSGTALAFRDRLVLDWNKTQQTQTFSDQKRIYCVYLGVMD